MSSGPHKPSIIIFALCSFVMIVLWGLILSNLVLGVFTFLDPIEEGLTPGMYLSFGGIALYVSLLIIPSAYYALRRMINRQVADIRIGSSTVLLAGLVLIWAVFLALGKWIEASHVAVSLLMPVLNIIVISIPVYLLVHMAVRNAPLVNPQKPWGVFNFGMLAGTTLSFLLEFVLVLIGIFGVAVLLSGKSELANQLTQIFDPDSGMNPAVIEKFIEVLFSNPNTIYILMLVLSVATPLIEESSKPLGIFLLGKKLLTPGDGFYFGVLSGAGFGLLESLLGSAQSTGIDWISLAVIRIGSDTMHILASGLVGWGIVSLFRYQDWKRFLLNVSIAIGLHGIWNGLAIVIGVYEVIPDVSLPDFVWLSTLAPVILFVITLISLAVLWSLNRKFFHQRLGE